MKAAYFTHDFNARTDPKLQEVIMTHGMAGIGVYWCIIEQMYEQGGELPLNRIKGIAFNLHTDIDIVESVIKDFDLFAIGEDTFTSLSLQSRIKNINEKSEKAKQAINARWKRKQEQAENNTIKTQEEYECNTDVIQSEYECNTIKLNKIKENNIKEKEKEKEKEKSSSSSIGKEVEIVKKDNTWVEQICMNYQITPKKLFTMLNDFKAECIANGIEKHRDIADVKSHINNWLRIQINNNQKKRNNEDSNTNKRRGLDVSDNADYSGEHF